MAWSARLVDKKRPAMLARGRLSFAHRAQDRSPHIGLMFTHGHALRGCLDILRTDGTNFPGKLFNQVVALWSGDHVFGSKMWCRSSRSIRPTKKTANA
jgi:hypothetical protein